jgi:hypothetical protein
MPARSFHSPRPLGTPASSVAAETALSFGAAPNDSRPNVFSTAHKAFKLAKKAYQWKKRIDYFRLLLDSETRTSGEFKAGLDWVPKLLTRALESAVGAEMPVPMQAHPYFRYHKVLLDQFGVFTQEMRNGQRLDDLRAAAINTMVRILKEAHKFSEEYAVGNDRWLTQTIRIALSNGDVRARQQGAPRPAGDAILANFLIRREIQSDMVRIMELEGALTAARAEVDAILAERLAKIDRMKRRNFFGQYFAVMAESADFFEAVARDQTSGSARSPEQKCDDAIVAVRTIADAWARLVDDTLLPY